MTNPNFSMLSNAVRFLSIDAVEKAKSGHPGMPMGMADIATVLWREYLNHSPKNPNWWNRDRFVLSNGHGSMLLYSLLHLSGYPISIDDIKAFRSLHSKTAGHPEFGLVAGIETTTGPLGQGISNAVGFALAETLLSREFNTSTHTLFDHYTYVFMGDGCLMEGISHEACALAATWKLSKLIAFYDDNGISIDGEVCDWMTESVPARFAAYGWNVIDAIDGHDSIALSKAIAKAKDQTDRPTIIVCKTKIGFGSPNKVGKESVHGSPLGPQEVIDTRKALNWDFAPFEIPSSIYNAWDASTAGDAKVGAWETLWKSYQETYPEKAQALSNRMTFNKSSTFDSAVSELVKDAVQETKAIATRQASKRVLDFLAPNEPLLLGGSADLTGSNLTDWKGCRSLRNGEGNYIHYGVREFGMTAIMNGLYLHGGFIPYGGTFLVFSDYARNAIRLSALMKLGVIQVLTHDSIGLGEDGPTHQPVEHAASLRFIPGLSVWRPADYLETVVAWLESIQEARSKPAKPSALLLSRQALPVLPNCSLERSESIRLGGYVLEEASADPKLILLATGSEVHLAVQAKVVFEQEGVPCRVVSMPSTTRFDQQSLEYKNQVLLKNVPVVAIEAGHADFWYKYTGHTGAIIGMTTFGESAPAADLFAYFGITVEAICAAGRKLLAV